jgi:hypothetical protein
MSIASLRKAITDAKDWIEGKNPTFFAVPAEKGAAPHRVSMKDALQRKMRRFATDALERAADLEQIAYDPDARIERGEQVLLVSADKVNDEADIYDVVENLPNYTKLDARRLVDVPTRIYGVAFGTTSEERMLFLRRRKVDSIAAGGGQLIAPAGDALDAIDTPGLVIDRTFDLIIFPEGVAAFDHQAFEKLVRVPADVSAELRKNADAVALQVPFAPGILDALVARGEKGPMIRRKLRSIVERDHLNGVTIGEIRRALSAQGRAPKDYIKKSMLTFDITEALFVLRFLDEGTWRGWKTNTLYAAGGRSVVT